MTSSCANLGGTTTEFWRNLLSRIPRPIPPRLGPRANRVADGGGDLYVIPTRFFLTREDGIA